ncbi:diaminopimelate epimerase [Bacillus sp. 1P06AnD]|uniref:diaminopimelate epimerase n=1 Tax=Bacillus sp. 1P06AnD TaxID=3132208 RepID=UPI0039A234EB
MRIKREWKGFTYIFDFFVEDAVPLEDELGSKEAVVQTKVFTGDKELLWEGPISVKWNHIGIYPDPKDMADVNLPMSGKRMLLIELRRYVKPNRHFI